MGVLLSLGCSLIGFGFLLSLLGIVVSQRAHFGLIAVSSAFAWLLGAMSTSLVYSIVPAEGIDNLWSIVVVMIGVAMQNGVRVLLVDGYIKLDRLIAVGAERKSETVLPLNDMTTSLAAGAGWSFMHAVIMLGTVLVEASGTTGAVYSEACPSVPLVFLTAIVTCLFSILDVAMMCMTFGARRTGDTKGVWLAAGLHLAASCTTLFNQSGMSVFGGCKISLPMLCCVVIAAGVSLAQRLPGRESSYGIYRRDL